ncbi:2OG-Fe(II) oxygenase [Lysobacter sp. HA35]
MSPDAPAPSDDFIHVVDGALDAAWCAQVVERLARSAELQPGRIGGGVFPDMKDSRDLAISGREDWRDVVEPLNEAVIAGLRSYVRRWPHTLVAPLMLETQEDGKRHRLTGERLQAMDDAALTPLLMQIFRPGMINLQRYTAGRGGYPYWHCELMPRDASAETLHRHLLWTVYLNDGFTEGETEFLYQRRKVAPKTGSLLIAPAAFTHTHRGNRPQGGDKVIATSWILFQRAEVLFGAR